MNRPETPTEAMVAEVLGELLGLETVDPTEDFFAMGGHSLLAVQAVQALSERADVSLELASFFDLGSVREVAAELDRLRAAAGQDGVSVLEEGEL